MATIAVIGALDTKGPEVAFLRNQIDARGHHAVVVDVGVLGTPAFAPEISRIEVARAGGRELALLVAKADRGAAVAVMAEGAAVIAARLHASGWIDAVLGLGGEAGSAIAMTAMRALPLGVPKVMISTLAGTGAPTSAGIKDIVMVPAVVDVAGVNRISRGVFARAVGAVCGMVESRVPDADEKPAIAASMFASTSACVEHARSTLESFGYDVFVFHAVGSGGQTMESVIEAEDVSGVFDDTLTEWADEVVGGVLSAGPARLDAAARNGTPAVYAPGGLDMVNFWTPDTVPTKFKGRRFHQQNDRITLMRTTPEENAELGRIIAGKITASRGPAAMFLPLRGVSSLSAPGGPFHWPEADIALFDALRRGLRQNIPIYEVDTNINDREFSRVMTEGLLAVAPRAARRH